MIKRLWHLVGPFEPYPALRGAALSLIIYVLVKVLS